MKNKELFDRTVSILVRAYQNDTLKHGDCSACAVGNIVRGNMEYPGGMSSVALQGWPAVFCTLDVGQRLEPNNMSKPNAKNQIKATGYGYKDLAKIEYSFESANKGLNDEEWMFNGLMSVIDTLMQIHEATTEEAAQAKELFVNINC